MVSAVDDIQDDDEAVRCICGHDDYPGPPPFDPDAKYGLKDALDYERIFGIEITDEMAGNFVQCEQCNSWQHSACVGFTTEESNPSDVEYFCEQCHKELHKVYTANNGQKYSIFLPIHRTSRAASRATSAAKDGAQSLKPNGSTKSSHLLAAMQLSKRRSTMNSRDAAYDEDEQLRQAIEASKEDAVPEDADALGTRRPKRGRDDSEDRKLDGIKRQRTDSKSPEPTVEKPPSVGQDDSDEDSSLRNGSKKSRNAARNAAREKSERDERREEQEHSDPSEEIPLAARAAANRTATESVQPADPPPSSQPNPDTPPTIPTPSISHKKKGASHHKKGKGRNQYTKDRDNYDHDASPARSMSRDVTRNAEESGTSHAKTTGHEGGSKHGSKAKGGMNSRVTMTDMKRRANAILDYISRTQVELASDPLAEAKNSPGHGTTDDGSTNSAPRVAINGNGGNKKTDNATPLTNGSAASTGLSLKEFKDMSCVEMMDILARDLVKWQQEFAP
ncbi:putative phd-finger domain-containing protein [Eutypa lata UCREL1]|uniref:Putative phd-finger domain-containing protein n=1 Tax=Eutypa lata (strain UCR-EL1) TaxID=1287681 RepID=M7TMB6_EUTLA|nr:putative phd-finger domain-containing protein [Eutypa lata UCREL1]